MSKPIAVVISDIHFNLITLPLASAALKAAFAKAEELDVPTVIAGDLHDTKDIIRGKVANELILLLQQAKTPVYILVGNHDLLNEKSSEHGLNYLRPYATIVDSPHFIAYPASVCAIPYQNDSKKFSDVLKALSESLMPTVVIAHQGFLGASMGDYVQDKTSIDPATVKDFIIISGHYHRHQTIGTVTYIGSPFTMSFGEANDGPKGFLALNEDGTFAREILDLRKHVIIEATVDSEGLHYPETIVRQEDLLWIKIRGSKSELDKINRKHLIDLFGVSNFKFDLISDEAVIKQPLLEKMTNEEFFDTIIDEESETEKRKTYLKGLFRELIES